MRGGAMPDTKKPLAWQRPSQRRKWKLLFVLLAAVLGFVALQPQYKLYRSATQPLQYPTFDESRSGQVCEGNLLPPKSIAVIGAGSAGSSVAYYLPQYASACQPFNVTVFERATYVGGRSTTVHPWDSTSAPAIELGGSIFVEANRNLMTAAADLDMPFRPDIEQPEAIKYDLGVWDGSTFRLLIERDLPTWRLVARLLYRYGRAPLKLQSLKNEVINRFLSLYSAPHFPFLSLDVAAKALNLDAPTSQTGAQLLTAAGVGAEYARDVVQASTRVNYAANLDAIHGLETLVSMAADGGARSIEGGNWRLFSAMLGASGAALRLHARVARIDRDWRSTRFDVQWTTAVPPLDGVQARSAASGTDSFDAVVLAAPWHQADIEWGTAPNDVPPPVEFVKLHVTLFASPFALRGAYFGGMPGAAPGAVLTTTDDDGNAPPFQSISLLRRATNPNTKVEESVYKVFSLEPLQDAFLLDILDLPPGAHGKDAVSWRFDKLWHSYPVLEPTSKFHGPMMTFGKAEAVEAEEELWKRGGGFWYTGGIEPFISTMETSSLAGRNVAALLAQRFAAQAQGEAAAEVQKTQAKSKTEL